MYMKRVAVIAIFMAVMATLFAFPVFADTPVQPLQVITYSDTNTNVRISGTAERLHYNIDSFQVVFMNPPNNYGTSCTPVLVSFRFYNASDIPAYVGQPEFELTATTGTGAVNTIIYGYDQISTDLFVAESSYSTAEVGRIGIGASNDFAYYTGFVIPPRTSLYFSCIVYVNASAYGQNNTGATEDVNQVTLSALNLYSNQISFSEDYPYHNQPIDFTDIIDAISDLSDTVSTSSEMQNIIQLLTYTGGTYTPSLSSSSFYDTTYITDGNVSDLQSRIFRIISNEYYMTNDIEINSTDDNIMSTGTKVRLVNIRLILVNNSTTQYVRLPEFIAINEVLPTGSIAYEIVNVDSQDFASLGFQELNNSATGRRISFSFVNAVNGYGYIGPKQRAELNFTLKLYYRDTVTPAFNNPSIRISTTPRLVSDIYAPRNIYQLLRDWYLSYKNINGLNDIDDSSDEIADKSETAHTQEQSYFTQNAQAIEQTGLSNYQFSSDQENGIGSVSHDFTLLWNALGGFNSVYIFSLTLSLALMVLRHAPGAIRSSRRNKEE